MANIKISAFDMAPLPLTGTEKFTGLVVDGMTNNANALLTDMAIYANSINTVTNTVVIGTGSSFAYNTIYQAWQALKSNGFPLTIIPVNDITEDGNIVFNIGDPSLSIKPLDNITIDWGNFKVSSATGADVGIYLSGNSFNIVFEKTSAGILFDFINQLPASLNYKFDGIKVKNNSAGALGLAYFFYGLSSDTVSGSVDNFDYTTNDGENGGCFFVNAKIGKMRINGDSSSISALGIQSGYCTVEQLIIGEGFSPGQTVAFINNKSVINSVINLDSAIYSIENQGGIINNIIGPVNILMNGSEATNTHPIVNNGVNTVITFIPPSTGDTTRSAGIISNVFISNNSNIACSNGGAYKFTNCVFEVDPSWDNEAVVQYSNCQYMAGYAINKANTIITNGLAGLSNDSGAEQFSVVSPSLNSIVVATIGNNAMPTPIPASNEEFGNIDLA